MTFRRPALRGEVPEAGDRWRRGPATTRTISGMYSPQRDTDEHIAVESLFGAFQVLVHVRETSPVRWLYLDH
ncbi:hypothetical protein [Nocardia sp. NPDC003183]